MSSPITRKAGEPYLTGTDVSVFSVQLRHEDGAEDWEIAREFGLDTDQVEYALKFARRGLARVAKKRDPERRAKVSRGRAQKRRGYRCEKRIEAALAEFGFARVPMSGALGGLLSGDLRRPEASKMALHVVEVKQRRGGHATLRRWLGQGGAELLVVDPTAGEEPIAVMTLATLRALLAEANYGTAVQKQEATA